MTAHRALKITVVLAAGLVTTAAALPAHADVVDECATVAERAGDALQGGHYRAAIDGFTQCAKVACPRLVRDDCREALARARTEAPRLSVRAHDGTRDLPRAAVEVDGTPVHGDDGTRGVVVDPGLHVVRASLEGFEMAEVNVAVAGSEHRSVELLLVARHAIVVQSPSAPRSPNRTAAYVAGGVGATLLAVFGVLGAVTYADYRALDRRCGGACSEADVEAPRTRGTIADVAFGTGIVAIGVAAVLWVTASPSH